MKKYLIALAVTLSLVGIAHAQTTSPTAYFPFDAGIPTYDGSSSFFESAGKTFVTSQGQPHSMFALVKPTATGSYSVASFGGRDDTNSSTGLGIVNGQIAWLKDGLANYEVGNLTIPLNEWSFIGFVRTASSVKFYVNGRSVTLADSSARSIEANDSFLVGAAASNGRLQGHFSGSIDNVRIYNQEITSQEASALHVLEGGIVINQPNDPPAGDNPGDNPPASEPPPYTGVPRTYNVNRNGGGDFTTIQACANAVYAGDTCVVAPGLYPEKVTISRSGTASAPIIIRGGSGVTLGGFTIRGAYVQVRDFALNLTNVDINEAGIYLGANAHYTTVSNVSIQGTPGIHGGAGGVGMEGDATYARFENITIHNVNYHSVVFLGNNHVFTGGNITGDNGWDVFRIIGSDIRIANNTISVANPGDANPNHADIFQSFGDNFGTSKRVLIENNTVLKGDGYQLGNITDDQEVEDISDWTFRNNVFMNLSNTLNLYAPKFKFYNNVFYRVGTNSGFAMIYGSSQAGHAHYTQIFNNIFIESGDPLRNNRGWYAGDPVTGLQADYNYVVGTGVGTIKIGFQAAGLEAHGINGLNPMFVNPAAGDFRLQSGSPAINAGVALPSFNTDKNGISRPQGTSWDIGAYEFNGSQPTQNGICSTVVNRCLGGTYVTLPDSSTQALWQCSGGTSPTCSLPIATAYKQGDFNKDGWVNTVDYSDFVTALNTTNTTYDLNKDGKVNTLDYAILVRDWTPLGQ